MVYLKHCWNPATVSTLSSGPRGGLASACAISLHPLGTAAHAVVARHTEKVGFSHLKRASRATRAGPPRGFVENSTRVSDGSTSIPFRAARDDLRGSPLTRAVRPLSLPVSTPAVVAARGNLANGVRDETPLLAARGSKEGGQIFVLDWRRCSLTKPPRAHAWFL